MYKTIVLSLFLFAACRTDNIETPPSVKNTFQFSIVDSLNKYDGKDSLIIPFKIKQVLLEEDTTSKIDEEGNYQLNEIIDTTEAILFIGKTNQANFAFTFKGSTATLFQKDNMHWQSTDSVDFFDPPLLVNKMDLNGDGLKDLRLSKVVNSETGDLLTCVFLFQQTEQKFIRNESFDKNNVQYDSENRFVRSWLSGTEGQCAVKWRASMFSKSLSIDSTIAFCLDQNSIDSATVSIYLHGNSANNPPIRVIRGSSDSLWAVFSKTFWNSEKDIKQKRN